MTENLDQRRRRLNMPMAQLCRLAGLPCQTTWRLIARRELPAGDLDRLDVALRAAECETFLALAQGQV